MIDINTAIDKAFASTEIPLSIKKELIKSFPTSTEDVYMQILNKHENGIIISNDLLLCPKCKKVQPVKNKGEFSIKKFCSCCGQKIVHQYSIRRDKFVFSKIIFIASPLLSLPTFFRADMTYNLANEDLRVEILKLSQNDGILTDFISYQNEWGTDYIKLYDEKKITQAFLAYYKYADCEDFKKEGFWISNSLTYCFLYMKYPYIELLLKTKYKGVVVNLITNFNESTETLFKRNFKNGKNLKEILPMPEWVYHERFNIQELNEARIIYNKYHPTKEAFESFLQLNLAGNEIRAFKQILAMKYDGEPLYTFDKLVTYIGRCDMYQAIDPRDCITILRDYLDMSITSETKPDTNSNSLKREHDITARNYRIVVNKIMEEKFIKKADYLKKYEYENKDFKVVVPATPQDLINEGRNNRNCVGSYIQSFANGNSKIFFIRKASDPDSSYVTLEMRGSKITQAYLAANRTITDKKTIAFIDEWQIDLKKRKIIN